MGIPTPTMTLTLDHGPLSTYPPREANYSVDGPPHKLLLTPFPRRVRAVIAGEAVLDSRRGMLLHESNILPQLYVPEEDVRAELLELTDQRTHCPFKGDAAYRSIRVGDRVAENALWHYPEPLEPAAWLRGLVGPYWDRFDEWWDEDERVHGHLRDPYHRVDVRDSTRHVVVRAGDEVVADSIRPKLLSETGLPNRYYLPREDVRAGLMPTDTSSHCPYKGDASYWTVAGIQDAAWSYAEPLEDAVKAGRHVCFLHDDLTIEVDGEPAA